MTHQLLRLLPLLQVGKTSVKKAYLQLIPELLSHTIHKGVNVEESRQLLSYSLIHPAITTEERGNFQMWMRSLEDRFTHSGGNASSTNQNNQHNIGYHQHHLHHLHCGGSSSGSSTAASSSVGGSSSNTSNNLSVGSHCHSPSPGSSSHHSLGLNSSPDISASQEYINIITNKLAVPPPASPASQPPACVPPPSSSSSLSHHHHHHPPPDHNASPSPIGGSGGAQLSWNSQQSQQQSHALPDGYSGSCEAGAAINPTAPAPSTATSAESSSACCAQPFVPSSNGHLTLRAANSHVGAFGAAPGHMPLHATSSAPPNFNSMPPPSGPSQGN